MEKEESKKDVGTDLKTNDPTVLAKTESSGEQGQTNLPEQAQADPYKDLLAQIDQLKNTVDEHFQNYLRARADLDNYRKRFIREKEEVQKYAVVPIIEQLMPVIDSFQLGLDSAKKHSKEVEVIKGFELVYSQLSTFFSNLNVKQIMPINEAFNPNLHDCIASVSHDTMKEGHVVQVVRTGYMINDRLIRPASVIVSSGPTPATDESEEN